MTLLLSGCVNDPDPEIRTLIEVGDVLPEFRVRMNDGKWLSTEDLRGADSMIVLFTTGCSDCRRELPVIQEYALCHENVRVICISRSEGEGSIAQFWEEHGLSLAYSAQSDDKVYSLFATGGVPRIYCANADLRVTAVYLEKFGAE